MRHSYSSGHCAAPLPGGLQIYAQAGSAGLKQRLSSTAPPPSAATRASEKRSRFGFMVISKAPPHGNREPGRSRIRPHADGSGGQNSAGPAATFALWTLDPVGNEQGGASHRG